MLLASTAITLAQGTPTPTPAPAPVQVEVYTTEMIYSYDCWPVGDKRFVTPQPGDDGVEMIVWLSYPTGLAGYRCDLVGRAIIIPMPRRGMKTVARKVRRVDGRRSS